MHVHCQRQASACGRRDVMPRAEKLQRLIAKARRTSDQTHRSFLAAEDQVSVPLVARVFANVA
jgi:hypothetical protein